MSSESFEMVSAGDVGVFRGGSGFPIRFQGQKGAELPFFKVSDMNTTGNELFMVRANNYVSEKLRASMGANRIPAGAIVFAKVGAAVFLERKRILAQDSCIDNNMAAFIVDSSRADVRFLHYLLSAFKLSSLVATTALPSLNGKQLRSIPLVMPSRLDEQIAIAKVLSSVDELIGSLEGLIKKKYAIQEGVIRQLLSGRTRLPGFTSEWQEVLLGEHVTYVKTVALSRAELDSHSPLRYLHYGDIHTSNSVRLDAAHDRMPRAAAAKARNAGRLQVGDLVFADASEDPEGVGKSIELVSIPPGGVVPGLHTIAARFDKTVLADGFKAYLQFVPGFREALLRLASGTKVLATTRKYISSVALNLPGIAEQQAIAEVLKNGDAEIEALRRQLERVRNIKQGMMQELLTGRTRLKTTGVSA